MNLYHIPSTKDIGVDQRQNPVLMELIDEWKRQKLREFIIDIYVM